VLIVLPRPAPACSLPARPQLYFSKWGETGVVDLKQEFSKLIALTAARTLLGREIREQLFDQVRKRAAVCWPCLSVSEADVTHTHTPAPS
jgi:hypothetical protein